MSASAPRKATNVFEAETCGRCGGSGHYSFNQIDGSRCYGCGGSGRKLTKRGAAARDYWRWMLTTEARYVRPGDRMWVAPGPFNRGGWKTVESVEAKDGHVAIETAVITMRDFPDSDVRLAAGPLLPAMLQSLVAFQDSLTKAGKPRKRVTA